MQALTPWTNLGNELDRLVDRLWESGGLAELSSSGEWSPALDVTENKDSLVVRAEVPGIDPKDIQVSLQDRVLTIKGEKKHEKEETAERSYRMERSWGAFARSVRLPVSVDAGKVSAAFKHGVLTITLPKTPGAKGTAIPIKAE